MHTSLLLLRAGHVFTSPKTQSEPSQTKISCCEGSERCGPGALAGADVEERAWAGGGVTLSVTVSSGIQVLIPETKGATRLPDVGYSRGFQGLRSCRPQKSPGTEDPQKAATESVSPAHQPARPNIQRAPAPGTGDTTRDSKAGHYAVWLYISNHFS